MSQLLPYRRLSRLLQKEAFEPTLIWGLRMAIAAVVPVIWGVATDNMEAASWITLTAEAICFIELKGNFALRFRVLAAGTVLAFLFAALGSAIGANIWLSVVCMFGVGFVSGLFKNLGDRGSGLANCVYIIFIFTNAYPATTIDALQSRLILVLTGGLWIMAVSAAATAFMPAQQPYRRSIALIWKSIAELIETISKGWDGKTARSNMRDIYLKEKAVRVAMDNSLHYHENLADQANTGEKEEYELAQLRKATAIVGAHIIGISQELENLSIRDTGSRLRLKLYAMTAALQQMVERMAMLVITMRPEERLLLLSRINRVNNLVLLLKQHPPEDYPLGSGSLERIILLTERSIKIVKSALERIDTLGKDLPVFRSYSLVKTLFILHPKYLVRNLQLLFNFNTFTTKYALRAAVAATIGMFISKWFEIDRGYWIPFTVIIILQPYFGATISKAIDRVIGTILGGLVGGIFLRLPTGLFLQEAMLVFCAIMIIYFLRTRYAVSVFFITISMVLLFDVEAVLNPYLIITRAACTAVGAALAIVAGFALLPHWDKKWLPVYLADAICCNYHYFLETFYGDARLTWTKHKRNAESKNSNAFDSFNRYMQEPGAGRKYYSSYFQIVTHTVRITRELNNIHLEEESAEKQQIERYTLAQQKDLVMQCHIWFNKNLEVAKQMDPKNKTQMTQPDENALKLLPLSLQQVLYAERMVIELKAMHQDMQRVSVRI